MLAGLGVPWRALPLLLLLGCGDFVRYEPGAAASRVDAGLPPPIPPPPGLSQQARLDHAAWDDLLSRFVRLGDDGYTRVDYAAMLADPGAMAELDAYLDSIANSDPGALADGDERLAFYINAYNASVVRAVLPALTGDPSFSPDDGGFAFFGRPEHSLAGVRLTLDQIEHGILRGDFLRPGVTDADAQTLGRMRYMHEELRRSAPFPARVHMALNCAALSCPNLQPRAYLGEELQAQLAAASAEFLESADKGAGPRGISSLFRPDWFEADFVASAGGVAAFIEDLRPGGLSGVALGRFLDYDWTLNAAR